MMYIPYPFKRCVKCGQEFRPTEEFFYRNGKFLRVECRICTKAYRDSIRADKEKVNSYNRKRYHQNREKESQRKRIYRETYPDRYRAIGRRSQRMHPETKRVNVHRYKSRKLELPDTLTHEEWNYALEYFHYSCAVCGRPRGLWHTLAMDHWIPVSSPDCPGTVATNIVPLCHGEGGCNNSKRNRNPTEWLIATLGKRKAAAIVKRIADYFARVAGKSD